MRRRPQPSRRRGLIRAGLVVLALTVVLVLVLFFASTRTANAPTAPTVPVLTPHPLPTIHLTPSPKATSGVSARATATKVTPHATASTTAKHSLGSQGGIWHEYAPSPPLRSGVYRVKGWRTYFTGARNAYRGGRLVLANVSVKLPVGQADPFVRPAVDRKNGSVLFVRVAQTKAYPGAQWSLWKYRPATQRSPLLTKAHAMGLTPLGWRGNDILYTITRPSDTSVYAVGPNGRSRFVAILIPQPVVTAFLSPDSRLVAFAAPTNCAYCTLDVYDLQQSAIWNGPSGAPSEDDIAWTADGSRLIFADKGKLAVVIPGSGTSETFAWPHGLPSIWVHTMTAQLTKNSVELTDPVTGRVYRSH